MNNGLPNVAICHPYYRQWEGGMGACVEAMAYRCARFVNAGVLRCHGAYVEDNRNGCVKLAFETGVPWDWLLWIDTDMEFPADALLRLLADDPPERFKMMPEGWVGRKDIVGANYRSRVPLYGFTAHYRDGGDTHLEEGGLWPMDHIPTGFMLVRWSVFTQIIEYEQQQYKRCQDTFPAAIRELERMGGQEAAIVALRERLAEGAREWFRPGNRNQPRDDVYFCAIARQLGYEIWCDHDLTFEMLHTGDSQIPWFTVEKQLRASLEVEGAELWVHQKRGLNKPRTDSVLILNRDAAE